MEDSEKASVPPEQVEGIKKDLEESVSFDTLEDAEDMFVLAKQRLLHVNDWHRVSQTIKSGFRLVDDHGHPLHRSAHRGDLICIDIPGPGSPTGAPPMPGRPPPTSCALAG